jgi:glycosyltransferase involved in cell wall biosynthesis
MIIIEASHIHFGGGYNLLIYLLEYLETKYIKSIVYISYEEIYIDLKKNDFFYSQIIKTSSFSTFIRYAKKRSNVLYFCNLPPFVSNKNSITYIHNVYRIEKPKFNNFNIRSFYFFWIKYFINNTSITACQTKSVKQKLNIFNCCSEVIPFFKMPKSTSNISKFSQRKYDFCYVAFNLPHKNYLNLLKACSFLSLKTDFKIAVTIEQNFQNKNLLNFIEDINQSCSSPVIFNLGKLNYEQVLELYQESRCLIFPSLKESFGLPIIEAMSFDLKILSSDVEYSFELLDNPITFDPYSPESIKNAMYKFLNGDYEFIYQKLIVKDEIYDLVKFLMK